MKRILILAPIPFKSGTQLDTYLRIKATALADTTNEIDLITFPHGDDVKIPNLNIIRIPKHKMFKEIMPGQYIKISIYSILMFIKFIFIKKNKYDCIFIYISMYLICWILKPFIKCPVISTIYCILETESVKWNLSKNRYFLSLLKKYDIYVQNKYDYLIFGNKLLMKYYEKVENFNDKIIYIPFAFEQENLIKKSDNIVNNTLRIIYTGTFSEIQNVKLILDAAYLLRGEDIKFELIGATDKEIEEYKKIISSKNINNVEIIQWMKNTELIKYLINADILISSRFEGIEFPMKIFAYMSYEKCILATNRPIHTGVLNNETACLFEPNPEDLAGKIQYLKSNPEVVEKYGKKAKELFEKKYSFERMLKDYKKVLSNL